VGVCLPEQGAGVNISSASPSELFPGCRLGAEALEWLRRFSVLWADGLRNRGATMIKKVFVPALVFVLTSSARGQEAESLRERLYAEAPKKYQEYLQFAQMMKCRGVTKMTDSDTKQIMRETAYRCVSSQGLALVVSDVKVQGAHNVKLKNGMVVSYAEKARVIVKNSRYSFRLGRAQPEADWTVLEAVPAEKDRQDQRLNTIIVEDVRDFFTSHFSINGVELLDLLKDPTFVFKASENAPGGKPGLVRVSFSYGKPDRQHWEGIMDLDTEHFWCISEYAIKVTNGTDSWNDKVINHYEVDKDGVPLPTRRIATSSSWFLNTETISEGKVERHSGIPEREFTLSAFGLPEPPALENKTSRWYLWIAFSAFGALGAAFLLRKLRRRYQNVEAGKK
jgi:hypothetical protein